MKLEATSQKVSCQSTITCTTVVASHGTRHGAHAARPPHAQLTAPSTARHARRRGGAAAHSRRAGQLRGARPAAATSGGTSSRGPVPEAPEARAAARAGQASCVPRRAPPPRLPPCRRSLVGGGLPRVRAGDTCARELLRGGRRRAGHASALALAPPARTAREANAARAERAVAAMSPVLVGRSAARRGAAAGGVAGEKRSGDRVAAVGGGGLSTHARARAPALLCLARGEVRAAAAAAAAAATEVFPERVGHAWARACAPGAAGRRARACVCAAVAYLWYRYTATVLTVGCALRARDASAEWL